MDKNELLRKIEELSSAAGKIRFVSWLRATLEIMEGVQREDIPEPMREILMQDLRSVAAQLSILATGSGTECPLTVEQLDVIGDWR